MKRREFVFDLLHPFHDLPDLFMAFAADSADSHDQRVESVKTPGCIKNEQVFAWLIHLKLMEGVVEIYHTVPVRTREVVT